MVSSTLVVGLPLVDAATFELLVCPLLPCEELACVVGCAEYPLAEFLSELMFWLLLDVLLAFIWLRLIAAAPSKYDFWFELLPWALPELLPP